MRHCPLEARVPLNGRTVERVAIRGLVVCARYFDPPGSLVENGDRPSGLRSRPDQLSLAGQSLFAPTA